MSRSSAEILAAEISGRILRGPSWNGWAADHQFLFSPAGHAFRPADLEERGYELEQLRGRCYQLDRAVRAYARITGCDWPDLDRLPHAEQLALAAVVRCYLADEPSAADSQAGFRGINGHLPKPRDQLR